MSAFLHGLAAQLRLLGSLRRHRLMLVFFLGACLLSVSVYHQGFMRELPVAVYDGDGTGLTRTLARSIDATPELRVVTDPPPTLADAQRALDRNELVAVIVVPDGFTADLKHGRQAQVLVAADYSNILPGKTAQRSVAKVLATLGAGVQMGVLQKLGVAPSAALARAMPITATESLAENPSASYAPYVAPPFALSFVQLLVIFLAWSVFWPEVRGRPLAETLGRFTACFLVGLAAGLVVTYGVLRVDDLAPASAAWLVVGMLALLSLSVLLFCAAVSGLLRGGLFAFQSTVLLGMLSLMFSGLTWPWDAIPLPIQVVSALIPFTPFGQAARIFLLARADLGELAGPLRWMVLQLALYLAIILAAAALERLGAAVAARKGVRP